MKDIGKMTTEELVAYSKTLLKEDEYAIARALNKAYGQGAQHAFNLMNPTRSMTKLAKDYPELNDNQ